MAASEQEIINRARADLAQRLGVNESEITMQSVGQTDFSDAALGAPVNDEMSAQVITPGWRIRLSARGQTYEYRSNGKQLRLVNFKGENHRI
jgi:hypothetical protein